MKPLPLLRALTLSGLFLAILCDCTTRATHYSTSVVQYLYPDQKERLETPQIPRLTLPIKVGIAFVPETALRPVNLTEKNKTDLMQEVKTHFQQYGFVRNIEIIPSSYLTPKGGFSNLEQVRTMFNIDVIALISYDQTQFTDEGLSSITYWTLIGAYTVPGEKNATHTMVDAAVYDIASRKLLFRAPGVSYLKSMATPVNLTEQLRKDSLRGFQEASRDLITNLDEQLSLFKDRVKASPQEIQVATRPGYRGGSSLDEIFLGLLLGLGGLRLWLLKKKQF
jgi:rhombotail lipoprotein